MQPREKNERVGPAFASLGEWSAAPLLPAGWVAAAAQGILGPFMLVAPVRKLVVVRRR